MEVTSEVEIKSIALRIGSLILTIILFFEGTFLLISGIYENLFQCVMGTVFCISLCIFIILSSFSSSILYSEEGIEIRILWIKRKEDYSILANIMNSHCIGGYWINTLDNRHYHVWLPGTKNMMLIMCKEIKKHNNGFNTYIV